MIRFNGYEVLTEAYPNNETKVKESFIEYIKNEHNVLEFKYFEDGDLITLMFAKKRLDELGVSCVLFIWYMPYSRMDRKIDEDLFTLQYVCTFINWLNFEKVVVMEPHSKPTLNLLERAKAVYPATDWLEAIKQEIGFDDEKDHIVFPDKGAAARYIDSKYEEIGKDGPYKNVCVFEKKRDPFTGYLDIKNMKIKYGTVNPGSKCIIIDDLCSKGGTFEGAGNALKNAGASEVVLVVSHCERKIFEGVLLDKDSPISKIYTSESIMDLYHPKIKYMHVDVAGYVGK